MCLEKRQHTCLTNEVTFWMSIDSYTYITKPYLMIGYQHLWALSTIDSMCVSVCLCPSVCLESRHTDGQRQIETDRQTDGLDPFKMRPLSICTTSVALSVHASSIRQWRHPWNRYRCDAYSCIDMGAYLWVSRVKIAPEEMHDYLKKPKMYKDTT